MGFTDRVNFFRFGKEFYPEKVKLALYQIDRGDTLYLSKDYHFSVRFQYVREQRINWHATCLKPGERGPNVSPTSIHRIGYFECGMDIVWRQPGSLGNNSGSGSISAAPIQTGKAAEGQGQREFADGLRG